MRLFTAKPYVDGKIRSDVDAVLKSGQIAQGPKVKELEDKFSAFCNAEYGAALNSGTAALHSALFAVGVKPGDEVITTPFTFIATANSIRMVGARPVFVDIDENTFNIDPSEIAKTITSETKVILPVHLFGLLVNMTEIMNLAQEYNLKVVEDACQAHGAENNGKRAGSIGDLGAFSFYATKNMMSAEGGCVVSNNREYIEKIKSFRHHGQSLDQKYDYLDFGCNYRMTDIHAVIGLNQLEKLESFNYQRQENARVYDECLSSIDGIQTPYVPDGCRHVYHQYTIKVSPEYYGRTRDELIEELNSHDIYPGIFYPRPLHLFPAFRKSGYKEGDFPVSEKLSKIVVSLPVHPEISKKDVKRISKIIKDFKR